MVLRNTISKFGIFDYFISKGEGKMKKNKRFLALGLAVLMLGSICSGCGKSEEAAGSDAAVVGAVENTASAEADVAEIGESGHHAGIGRWIYGRKCKC